MSDQRLATRLADTALRTSFPAFAIWVFGLLNPGHRFVGGPHFLAMIHQLDRVMAGELTRLIVNVPPRSGKTQFINVALVAWLLGHYPHLRLTSVSHTAALAETQQLLTRLVMLNPRYRRIFPATVLDPAQATKTFMRTTRGGERRAFGANGHITGFGGDIILLDDIIDAADARSELEREKIWTWIQTSLMSRLDDPATGRIVMIGQRLHLDDPYGRAIDAGGWEVLELPAIEWRNREVPLPDGLIWERQPGDLLLPTRLTREVLDQKRREIGTADFEAQYNQRPSLPDGHLFKAEWFRRFDLQAARREHYEYVWQSWDTALSEEENADYTVCVTLGLRARQIHVLDVFRDRLGFVEQIAAIHRLKERFEAQLVTIEAVSGGVQLFEELHRRQGHVWAHASNGRIGKIPRAQQQTARIDRGDVWLPTEASWLSAFTAEVLAFPRGKNDDMVDAFVQGLRLLDFGTRDLKHTRYFEYWRDVRDRIRDATLDAG